MRRVELVAAFALALVVMAQAPLAHADVEPDRFAEALRICIGSATGEAENLAACEGASSRPCMEEDGGTTHGMVMCLSNEGTVWAEVMEEHLLRLSRANPDIADTLAAAQQAWRDYTDAQCSYRVALWGEGSGARVELASCYANMTADRATMLAALSP